MTHYVAEFRDGAISERVGPFLSKGAAVDWLDENDHPTSLVYALDAPTPPGSFPVPFEVRCVRCSTMFVIPRCPKCGCGVAGAP